MDIFSIIGIVCIVAMGLFFCWKGLKKAGVIRKTQNRIDDYLEDQL